MKNRKKFSDNSWYPNAVSISIGVLLYVVLTHLGAIRSALGTVGVFFTPVLLGCVIAYLMNPLAMLIQDTVFGNVKKESTRWVLSVFLSAIIVIGLLLLLLVILIPQLIQSAALLMRNIDGYMVSLRVFLDNLGIEGTFGGISVQNLINSSEAFLDNIATFAATHLRSLLSMSAGLGRSLINFMIAAILSIYLLCAKESLRAGSRRLLKAALSDEVYAKVIRFLKRCNAILIRYIVFSIIDAVIIGSANAVFMTILKMEYTGLVSVVVAVTNLIPTFGPLIGAVIGGFILVLVNPIHAVLFVVFTLVLQTLDGYIIKPKLFGDSLGVSGLLILISIVVCGNMFGIVGILLAIPIAAIVDFLYREAFVPWLEREKRRRTEEARFTKDTFTMDNK